MKFYADGRPRDPNKVKQRCADLIKRAEDGHPNGAIIVSTTDENGQEEPFAWFIAGGGSAPGVSEIACLMTLEKQQEGWGTKLIPTVKEYTDEIRRIGHGVDLKETEKWIQEKFSCFQGKPLEKLEATTSPLNEPSWKLLKSLGFYAKPIETEKKIEVNYKGQTLNKMVHGLTDLFNREENPLSKGELYSMIDHNSEKRTVSFHETWNIVKWHVEKNLGEQ